MPPVSRPPAFPASGPPVARAIEPVEPPKNRDTGRPGAETGTRRDDRAAVAECRGDAAVSRAWKLPSIRGRVVYRSVDDGERSPRTPGSSRRKPVPRAKGGRGRGPIGCDHRPGYRPVERLRVRRIPIDETTKRIDGKARRRERLAVGGRPRAPGLVATRTVRSVDGPVRGVSSESAGGRSMWLERLLSGSETGRVRCRQSGVASSKSNITISNYADRGRNGGHRLEPTARRGLTRD